MGMIYSLKFPDEFLLKPERERAAWVDNWCKEFLQPALTPLSTKHKYFFGEDFGRSGDITALWVLAQSQHLKLSTPLLVEIRNCPFEQQKQILFYVIERLPNFTAGALDGRGNGAQVAEAVADKFGRGRIEEVMISQEWYRKTMPLLKQAFEDHDLSIPKDDDVLSDLRLIKQVKGIAKIPDNEKNKGSDGKARHGDTAIALAMAIYAVFEMEPAPIEFSAVADSLERWSPAYNQFDGFADDPDRENEMDIGCL